MTITLSETDYLANKQEISKCMRGELCKIMSMEHMFSHKTAYIINADVLTGWSFSDANSYHGKSQDGTWSMQGLGTFHLIDSSFNQDGSCTLKFTDDLNPDLP